MCDGLIAEVLKTYRPYAILFPFLNNFLSGCYRSLYLIVGSVIIVAL